MHHDSVSDDRTTDEEKRSRAIPPKKRKSNSDYELEHRLSQQPPPAKKLLIDLTAWLNNRVLAKRDGYYQVMIMIVKKWYPVLYTVFILIGVHVYSTGYHVIISCC